MIVISLLWAGAALFTSVELIRHVAAPDGEGELPERPEPPAPEVAGPAVVMEPDVFERTEESLGLSVGALTLSAVGWVFPLARLASSAILLVGMVPIARTAWRTARDDRRVDFPGLIVLGTGFELALGYAGLASLNWLVFTGGKRLQAAAKRQTRSELADRIGGRDEHAWIVREDVELEVALADLDVEDRLIVRAGDVIPIDGIVVEGLIAVDQRVLTGESRLLEFGVGERVLAATLVLGGTAILVPERSGGETLAARLERLLAQADSYEQHLQFTAAAESERSVRPTLALMIAGLLKSGPRGLIAGYWANSADLAWLGSPYLIMNAIRVAAEHEIVIADGRSLDELARVDTMVFDKTGTLTLDSFDLEHIHVLGHDDEHELLGIAAALERHQDHPIAEAILAAAARAGVALPEAEQLELALGYGLRARIGGRVVALGGARFMAREGVTLELEQMPDLTRMSALGHSLIYLAIAGRCAAVLELAPRLRPEAHAVVASLQRRGLEIMLLSGDDEGPTAALATRLGISSFHARALPEDKAKIVASLQAAGRRVCFVGDGINDALALLRSNVSISMRGASQLAVDSAQIVLNSGSLEPLDTLFELAASYGRSQRTITTAARSLTAVGGIAVMFLGLSLPGTVVLYTAGVGLTLACATAPNRLMLAKPIDPARMLGQ